MRVSIHSRVLCEAKIKRYHTCKYVRKVTCPSHAVTKKHSRRIKLMNRNGTVYSYVPSFAMRCSARTLAYAHFHMIVCCCGARSSSKRISLTVGKNIVGEQNGANEQNTNISLINLQFETELSGIQTMTMQRRECEKPSTKVRIKPFTHN